MSSSMTTGFGSRMALLSNPLASAGVDGMTTFSPGQWASQASRLCECWQPAPNPAPAFMRTTSGKLDLPPER